MDPQPGMDIDKERDRMLALLLENRPKGVPEPTVIIFSGGGLQALWKLQSSIIINGNLEKAEKAKLYNLKLEQIFVADSCHNIDRVLRLAGTVNVPDAKKRKKGRTEAMATIIQFKPELVYDLSEFTPIDAPIPKKHAGCNVELGKEVARTDDLDVLGEWNVTDRIKRIITYGTDPGTPKKGDNSRSAWLFDGICALIKRGVPDNIIYGLITDPKWGISESVLDKGPGAEKYALRQIQRTKDHAIHPILLEINDKYAVVANIGGKCRIAMFLSDPEMNRTVISFQSFSDFKNSVLHINIEIGKKDSGEPIYANVGKWWTTHPMRRQHITIGLYPKGCSSDILNLWQGFAIKALKGDWPVMRNHILEVIACGNYEHFEYILRWLAFAVQYPEKPAEVALVLKGGKGTGKGAFANAMCKIFGQHGLHISHADHLAGKFNAHLADVCFLFADEAYFPGNKSAEGNLKSLITEHTLTIERKGVDVIQTPNRLHIVMASNENWIVPAGEDERRFAVFEVSSKYQQNASYFNHLFAEQENGGLAAMLYDLQNMDIKGWHPRLEPPKTSALNEQIIASLGAIERAWFYCLLSGELVFHTKSVDYYHLPTRTLQELSNRIAPRKDISSHAIAAFLGDVRLNADGSSRQARCMNFQKEDTRRPRGFWIPELPEARKQWDRVMFAYNWDGATEWDETSKKLDFSDIPF